MIILVVVAAAIVVALLRGGKLSRLVDVPFRYFYLLFLPLLIQLVIFSPLVVYVPGGERVSPYIYIFSNLVGAIVVWLNRDLPGFKLLLIGLLSNFVVIFANGGYMPVAMDARVSAGLPAFQGVYNNVIEMNSSTPLWFLGDIFPLPRAMPLANVFSIGDVLIALGGVVFIQRVLVPPTPPQSS